LDQQTSKALLEAIDKLNRRIGTSSKGFVRSNKFNRIGASVEDSTEEYIDSLEKQRKIFEHMTRTNTKLWKTMAEGVPIIGSLVNAVRENKKRLEKEIVNQSEAFKNAALATEEYTRRSGVNSKELKKIHEALSKVEQKAKELAESVSKRRELENRIEKNLKSSNLPIAKEKLEKDLSNISDVLKEAKRHLALEQDSDTSNKLKQLVNDLSELKKIPDSFEEIKKELSDDTIRQAASKDQAIKRLIDPIAQSLSDEIKESKEKSVRFFERVFDTFRGSVTAASAAIENSIESLGNQIEKINQAIRSSVGATLAATAITAKMEGSMLLARQRYVGSTFNEAMRGEAIMLGVAEETLLSELAENRYTLRRLGQREGYSGALEFTESSQFEQLVSGAKRMGLQAEEALRYTIDVMNTLRQVGADKSVDIIADTMKFIKDVHKGLGVSQEEMTRFTKEMLSPETMLPLLVGIGDVGSQENMRAMMKEIEIRGKLARVLNQDLTIQEKRLRELTEAAYGDPTSALEKAVYQGLLARQVGISGRDADLLRRYYMHGGKDLSVEERDRARILQSEIYLKSGRALDEAASRGDFGRRTVLTEFMRGGGINYSEAVQQYMQAQEVDLKTVNVESDDLANTSKQVTDLNDTVKKILEAVESLSGVGKSSFGAPAGAFVSGLSDILSNVVGGVIGHILYRKGLKGITGIFGKLKGAGGAVIKSARPIIGSGAGMTGRLGARAVPYLGTALLAHDAYQIGKGLYDIKQANNQTKEAKMRSLESMNRIIIKMQQNPGMNLPSGKNLEDLMLERSQLASELLAEDPTLKSKRPDLFQLGMAPSSVLEKAKAPMLGSNINIDTAMRKSQNASDPMASKYRMAAEVGIINLANSAKFGEIKDVNTLKKMKGYLLEDDNITASEEKVIKLLEEKIDELIKVNSKTNDLIESESIDEKERFLRMNDTERANYLKLKRDSQLYDAIEGLKNSRDDIKRMFG